MESSQAAELKNNSALPLKPQTQKVCAYVDIVDINSQTPGCKNLIFWCVGWGTLRAYTVIPPAALKRNRKPSLFSRIE